MKALTTVAAALLLLAPVRATAQQVTMETLLDRIQIEDLLTRYDYDLSQGQSHELSDDFTEDAMLDVDGPIAHGREDSELVKTGGKRTKDQAPRSRPACDLGRRVSVAARMS